MTVLTDRGGVLCVSEKKSNTVAMGRGRLEFFLLILEIGAEELAQFVKCWQWPCTQEGLSLNSRSAFEARHSRTYACSLSTRKERGATWALRITGQLPPQKRGRKGERERERKEGKKE